MTPPFRPIKKISLKEAIMETLDYFNKELAVGSRVVDQHNDDNRGIIIELDSPCARVYWDRGGMEWVLFEDLRRWVTDDSGSSKTFWGTENP